MPGWNRSFTISAKVFILTFLLIIFMVLLIHFLYYQNTRNSMIHSQLASARQFTDKSDEYLNLTLLNIRSFFLSIANDSKLKNGNYEQFDKWFNDNLILFIPSSKNIHLIKDGTVAVSTATTSWLLDKDQEFAQQKRLIQSPNQIYWTSPYYSAVSGYTVTALMRIPSDSGHELVLALDLDLDELYNALLPNHVSDQNGQLMLMDNRNRVIFGIEPFVRYDTFGRQYALNRIDEQLFNSTWVNKEQTIGGNAYWFARSQNNLLSWQVVWVIDKSVLLQPLRQNLQYVWFLAGLSLLLSFLIAYTVSAFTGRPIRLLERSMDQVGQGQWDTSIPVIRNDELGRLTLHFNRMTAKVRELIANLKSTEEAKKESDFLALQSQIRPHFIFNTLNSISMAARENQLEKVDRLISSFTESIHYSLNDSPAPIELEQELKALHGYIYLMQIRYEDQFELETDIDSSTSKLLVPKFTLQPLVENSIFHGLVASRRRGTLFIGTERGADSWDIIIEDTGVGMTKSRLAAIMDELSRSDGRQSKQTRHIGLRNVHSRLQSMFGEAYRIHIDSEEGRGTRTIITLPTNHSPEGGNTHDEAIDRR